MNLPDIWGQGSIFAFSGLDGENSYDNSLVGTLAGDRLGIIFHTSYRRELYFTTRKYAKINHEITASDIIKIKSIGQKTNNKCTEDKTAVIICFYSQDTVIGITSRDYIPCVIGEGIKGEKIADNRVMHVAVGEYTILATQESEDNIKFAFSYSSISKGDALVKAEEGLTTDIEQLVAEKMNYYKQLSQSLPQLNNITDLQQKTLLKCFSILKSQVYTAEEKIKSYWTTPDRVPHQRMWLWDSVFHALGNKYISNDLASATIKALFSVQEDDGFIPHMAAPGTKSDITQPPVIAWGLYNLYEASNDINILEELYRGLKKYLNWNMANRDENNNYLFEWQINTDNPACRCGECGMDNSPRFDNVKQMDCIDFSCFMANEVRYMSKITDALGMTDEALYWKKIFKKIKTAINDKLWDEEEKFYYDRFVEDGRFKKVKAVSSFLPLFAGVCNQHQARCLVQHLQDESSFKTEFPVPSIAVDDPTFGTDMWRGPVWINYNYMITEGLKEYGYHQLADRIIKKTINIISFWYQHDGTIYEFYDSQHQVSPSKLNRKGEVIKPYDLRVKMQCIRDYGWTAALYVAMVMENYS